MSEHSEALPLPEAERFNPAHAGRLPMLFLGAGVIGLVCSLLGLLIWRAQFAFSWLFGFTYFFTLCVGCLFWVCLHHATDAEWSVVVRRQLENVAGLIPYLAAFFIPVLLCAGLLFKWWTIPHGQDPLLDAKQPYLSHGFFIFRVIFYFVVLGGIAWWLRKRSTAQDADGASRHSFTMRKLGVGGIPAVGICLTFAAFDWLMALDYKWFSTMWGVYLFAGAAGSSMSLLVLIVTTLKNRGYLKIVTLEHYHIMGKFMLAFVIFWAYIGFSQYMLIWYANIPEETSYFQLRNTRGWWLMSTLLMIGRFVVPFPILLTQWIKKHPNRLKLVAIWIIVMQALDIFIIVMPTLHQDGVHFSDFVAGIFPILGIGGILGWLFLRNLQETHLFPTRDPRLGASIKLTN